MRRRSTEDHWGSHNLVKATIQDFLLSVITYIQFPKSTCVVFALGANTSDLHTVYEFTYCISEDLQLVDGPWDKLT